MSRERSVWSRPNLELARREVARPGVQVRCRVTFAVAFLAVALRTVFEIELLARLALRICSDVLSRHAHGCDLRGPQRRDEDREPGARTDQRGGHFVPDSSLARGLVPVKSYRKRIASQISSSFRNFSQEGMAVSHGPPSSGSPGPPLEIRQKRYVSRNSGIVSGRLVGIGSSPCTNMPVPARLSPWQKTQFR